MGSSQSSNGRILRALGMVLGKLGPARQLTRGATVHFFGRTVGPRGLIGQELQKVLGKLGPGPNLPRTLVQHPLPWEESGRSNYGEGDESWSKQKLTFACGALLLRCPICNRFINYISQLLITRFGHEHIRGFIPK